MRLGIVPAIDRTNETVTIKETMTSLRTKTFWEAQVKWMVTKGIRNTFLARKFPVTL